mmetsp:Transcript_26564/g.60498  ORF Transcript_26564/g.60498 Transcript_26564/m.60498 type:complete len:422 (-) Transcript_26564:109-1374(-)
MGGGAGKQKYQVEARTIKVASKDDDTPRSSVCLPMFIPKNGRVTLLTADVGGTSSRLHIFVPPDNSGEMTPAELVSADRVLHERKYKNARFESFTDIVSTFLQEVNLDHPPLLACLGVAGVVVENKVKFVNLGWTISGRELQKKLGIPRVALINDFEAQGYGVLTVDPDKDCEVLQGAPTVRGAPIALIGAGTGLGEAFLTFSENHDYDVWPSEGGHAEFAPRQDGSSMLQFEMLQYLQIKYSARARISTERVVSGKGIANIYEFLAWKFPEQKNIDVHHRFLGGAEQVNKHDPAVVVQAAYSGECSLCQKAIDMFVGAYGAEAGVLALKYMPYGGLFLTGGVTVKIKEWLMGKRGQTGHFLEAFLDKGRVSPMLHQIPVYLIKNEDLGEKGVRLKAMRLWAEIELLRQPSKGHQSEIVEA